MTVDRNVRAAAPPAAAVLALVVFAAMLLLTGLAQALVVYGAVLTQVAVLVAHARAGVGVDRRRHVPRFLAIWSGEAGLTFLWAGDGSTVSAAIYIIVGMVFAAVATVFLAYAGKADDEPAGPTDTRPLPVQVADGEARDE